MAAWNRISQLNVCILGAILCASCVVFPVPTHKHMKGASGTPVPKQADLKFIKSGETRRQEVLEKLAWADAGLSGERLFLARWKDTHMAVCAAAGGAYAGGADCGRIWHTRNVLIGFDQQGIVQEVRQVRERDLATELSARVRNGLEPRLDLSEPYVLRVIGNGDGSSATLILERDRFACDGFGRKRDINIPPEQILAVHTVKGEAVGRIGVEVYYTDGRQAARKLRFLMKAPDLLTLVAYFEQTRSGNL